MVSQQSRGRFGHHGPTEILLCIFSLFLCTAALSSAAVIQWQASGLNSTWTTGSNWVGGVAPANNLTGDIASFDQVSYAFLPNTGTSSVSGLAFGDGATMTSPVTLSGTNLSIGASGIAMAVNSGTVTIAVPVTIGAPQTWTNNSAALLTGSGTIATGSNALSIAGRGNVSLYSLSGTAGAVMNGTGLLTINNTLGTTGQLFKETSGSVYVKSARNTAASLEVDGGNLMFNGADRYSTGTNHQTFLVTGGTVSFAGAGGYGIRLNGDGGSAFGGNSNVSFTATQSGGVVSISGGGNGNFSMGNSSGADSTIYNLLGTGVLTATNGSTWTIGADAAGTSVTAFNMSGGTLLAASGMSGTQGTGARQAFVWTGGTLSASTYNATNLTSGTGIQVSATSNTLINAGGTLAPGYTGTPGRMNITGNYAVTSTSAVMSIDIGGVTAATVFQDSPAKYDNVAGSGTAALNGRLAIYLVNGFTPTPSQSFTILTGGTVTGAFQNVIFGSRMTTADGLGSFIVTNTGNGILLNNFLWLGGAPAITTQPQSTTVLTGHSATFKVAVTGSAPFTYQWYANGIPAATGTLPWFTIGSSGSNAAGSYYAVISNALGSVTSSTATLTVNPLSSAFDQIQYDLDQTPVYGTGAIIDDFGLTAGTLENTPAPMLVPGAASYTGSAWNFSTGSAYVQVAPANFLNMVGDISQTTGITVGFWVNLLYQGGDMDNCQAFGLGSVAGAFTPNISDATISFSFGAAGNPTLTTPLTPSILDGNWHHVIATIDFQKHTNNMTLYVDGTGNSYGSSTTVAVTASFSSPGTVLVLGALNGGGHSWPGPLDQFVMYDRALTGAEVQQLYTTGTVTSTAPLVTVGADNTTIQIPPSGTPSTGIYATVTPLVSGTWSKISGPAATIASSTSASTSVSLTGGTGSYIFRYTVSNGGITNYAELLINTVQNQAPVIGSCTASSTVLSDTAGSEIVTLSALATDDGYPNPPGILSSIWSQVSGPATISIAYPSAETTAATIPAVDGTYVMQYSVTDGALTSASTVAISVVSNFAPAAAATADVQTIIWNGGSPATTLRGTISDDGRPLNPGMLSGTWTQISGPATAILSTTSGTGTNTGYLAVPCPVTLPAQGQYVFQFVASDGALTATSSTWITVWSAGNPPIYAGCSRSLWLPNASVTLSGSSGATGPATYQWSVASGPGPVAFSNANALLTSATFTTAGQYRLLLTASSGGFTNADDVIVEVYPSTRNFGFTAAQLNSYFTTDPGLHHDFTNLNWARIAPPPPPYVHPRILFNPDDLPDLRARLSSTTISGPIIMGSIRTMAAQATSISGAYYSIYNDLAGGSTAQFLANSSSQSSVVQAIESESFRCLIDSDPVGGAKAASAVSTLAAYLTAKVVPPLLSATTNLSTTGQVSWQYTMSGPVFGDDLAWAYDFIYNYMNTAEQGTVRSFLSLITNNMWENGLDRPPGYQSSDSNHIPLTGQSLLYSSLAIEGETGWDPNVTTRYEAMHDRLCDTLAAPDGATYEGMGKGWIGAEAFLATAKRGSNAIAADMVKNHMRLFYPQCMETTGYGWTWDEVIGGNNETAKYPDVCVLKFLYPSDPVIDCMYRNACGPTYTANQFFANTSNFFSNLIVTAICAQDYTNMSQTWSQAMAQEIAPNVPLSQLFNQRGLLVTRSDWTSNGMRLMFQPRSDPGGHSIPDRNNIVLSGMGRIWVPWDIYGTGAGYLAGDASMAASVVRVDNTGSTIVPANVVDYYDSTNFTYAASNASDCYSMELSGNSTLASFAPNSKLLSPIIEPWMNQPWAHLPDWETGVSDTNYWTKTRNVQQAYRTACLIRGGTANPYSVVVDDIQMDNSVHNYKWRIMLANDLTNVTVNGNDAIVTSSTGGNVSMLVRLLSSSGSATFLTNNAYSYFTWPWLDIQVNSVAPGFKVLLMPYVNGTPLPATTWHGNVLYVTWPGGQEEHLNFAPNPDGRTRVSFARTTTSADAGPVISPPSNITTTASSAQGAVVNFTLTSTDAVDGTDPVVCNPPSGSLFPIGVTTVQASAADSALNASGTTFTVNVLSGIYQLTAPVLSVTGGNQSATLSWNAIAPALGYNILRSTSNGSGYSTIASSVVGTTYSDTTLTNGTTYYYMVQAFNDAGTGPDSNQVSVVPAILPPGWASQNIGNTGLSGSAAIASSGSATLSGAGNSINGAADSMYLASQPWAGNGTMVAHIDGFQNATNSSQAGIMFRQSLALNSANAYEGCQDYASQYDFSYRASAGGGTTAVGQTHAALPQWFELVRSGSSIVGYESVDALPGLQSWVETGSASIAMTGTIYAGLTVMSSNTNSIVTANFDSFGIYLPPTIQIAPNIVQAATGTAGSVVDYTITGTSNVNGQLTALCTPPSGSTFPIGTTTVTAVATDGAAESATSTFTVTILPPPPVISSSLSVAGTDGVAFSYQIYATNSPTSYSATGLPSGLAVSASTGLISGTPAVFGTFSPQIFASNLGGSGSAALVIALTPPPPSITPGAASGVTSSGAVLGGTVNPNGADTMVYYQSGLTSSYGSQTAGQDIGSGTSGIVVSGTLTGLSPSTSYHYQLVATSAAGTSSGPDQTFTTLAPPPVIEGLLTAVGTVNNPFTYQILASNNPTGYSASGLPAGLTADPSTGLISGTPTATGSSGVTIAASNATGTGSASLMVVIQQAPPVITSPLTAMANAGSAFDYQITATNSPITYSATGLPAGLTISPSTGRISGTPSGAGVTDFTIGAINSSGTGTATVMLSAQAPIFFWLASGASTAWATGSNWMGGVAPASSLSAAIAGFDQTSYAFQPNAGTTSIAGLQIGDGTTPTAALTIAGAALTLGSGGIAMAPNAGAVTIMTPVTLGAPQKWINNSASLLTGSSTISNGGNALTISGSGNITLTAMSGTGTVFMAGTGNLSFNNTLATAGQFIDITSGTTVLGAGRQTAANIEVDAGTLLVGGSGASNRYSTVGTLQTFTVTGGQVTYVANGGYGFRLNGDNGPSSSGPAGATFTGNQSGGVVSVSGGSNGNFDLGNSSGGDQSTYNLSGTGVLSVPSGNSWVIGADTAGTGATAFNLSGGKLSVSNSMSGAQGNGARQAFVWTGGTLAVLTYTAADLTSGTSIQVSAASNTLTNAGGTLAPGDIGVPGKTTVTGNYAVTSSNAMLAVDLSGTVAATAFQDTSTKYDNVAVTGTTALGGSLNVTLTGGFVPSSSGTFTILTSGAISGSFTNVAFGSRLATTDGLGTFLVSQTGTSITLTSFVQTGPLPSVTTLAATAITATGATLNGTVNANGYSTGASFDYGMTPGFGTSIAAIPGTVTGTAATSVSATITGLTPGDTYYYRVDGTSSAGRSTAAPLTFSTTQAAPVISSASTASASTIAAFAYQITATDDPTSFNAGALPAGLSIDPSNGLISGTPATAGTFNATISASNTAGSDIIPLVIMIAPAPYVQWQNSIFTTAQLGNSAISGDTADPAGDGISNLMKYALNLNPNSNGAEGLPFPFVITTGSGNFLTLTYTQVIIATDITYNVQLSTDLQNWYSGPGYTATMGISRNPDGETKSVTVQSLIPMSGTNGQQYMRLQVTRPR